MIPVTTMATGASTVSGRIKGHYCRDKPSRFTSFFRPVVFWNITYQCNLRCQHCYLRAMAKRSPYELSTEEARSLVEEMVDMGVPLLIISGGEPLTRRDLWEIVEPASRKGRPRLALSTNGTLIDKDTAIMLRDHGFTYVGVSIDSINPEWHDKFRGVPGAFEAALRGLKHLIDVGVDVGVRTTVTRYNIEEALRMVEWCVSHEIPRLCLYILDTVGRGEEIREWLPEPEQVKMLVDKLVPLAVKYTDKLEILLVRANFAGIYLADKLSKTRDEFIEYLSMLEAQGDCGRKTVSIYPDGSVKPCQFVDWVTLGNVREKRLREILVPDNPKLKPFLEIEKHLRGPRCSRCPFRRVCGGGSRGRARAIYNDEWGDEPLCFIDYQAIARKWGIEGVV